MGKTPNEHQADGPPRPERGLRDALTCFPLSTILMTGGCWIVRDQQRLDLQRPRHGLPDDVEDDEDRQSPAQPRSTPNRPRAGESQTAMESTAIPDGGAHS